MELNTQDQLEHQEPLPIKLWGTIKDLQYKFGSHNVKFGTMEDALRYQLKVSKEYPRNNLYQVFENRVEIHLKTQTLVVDPDRFEELKGRVWYERKKSAYAQNGENRICIDVLLFGEMMIHKNGDRYDCRRENLISQNKEIKPDDSKIDSVEFDPFVLNITNEDVFKDYLRMKATTSMVASSMGGKFTNFFMFLPMSLVRKRGMPNYHEAMDNEKYLAKIQAKIESYSTSKEITSNVFYKYWGYCFYKPGNFPAHVARSVYDFASSKLGRKIDVIDFSSGFGGRLTGFWMSDNTLSYTGIDPNERLFDRYEDMVCWLVDHDPKNKSVKMIKGCAEEVDIQVDGMVELGETPTKFDLCFTSPPYFDLEIYSDSDTQSCNRYTQIEVWTEKFLLTTLKRMIDLLRNDGLIIINIKNSNKWKYDVCGKMIEYLIGSGMEQLDTIYLKQTSRNGTGNRDEPMFVFSK